MQQILSYRTVLNTLATNTFIKGFLCVREKVQGAADQTEREISLLTPLTDLSASPRNSLPSVQSVQPPDILLHTLVCAFGTLNPALSSMTVS